MDHSNRNQLKRTTGKHLMSTYTGEWDIIVWEPVHLGGGRGIFAQIFSFAWIFDLSQIACFRRKITFPQKNFEKQKKKVLSILKANLCAILASYAYGVGSCGGWQPFLKIFSSSSKHHSLSAPTWPSWSSFQSVKSLANTLFLHYLYTPRT